jgi:hypothetical protein
MIDLWNRLGQKDEFGLPTSVTMEALGIGSYNTYKKTIQDLIDFGFVILISESKNQHQSKIVALSKNDKATDEATDKALDKAHIKATDTIIKQVNKETIEQINSIESDEIEFNIFWNAYDKKVDRSKCLKAYLKLPKQIRAIVYDKATKYRLSTPDVQFRKNPLTWINGQCWEDEIPQNGKKEIHAFHNQIFD